MNILDIIILICLIPALIQGLRKGFISQAISIISIIAGVWASAKFANLVGAWLSEYITASEQVLRVIAFAIILIGVFLALGLIARVLEKILKLVMLDWINKLLGAAFSIIKATLILGLIFLAVGSLNANLNLINPETFSNSVLYPVVNDTAEIIFPYLKSLFTLK
jgi:membrane protein required for colicin V production